MNNVLVTGGTGFVGYWLRKMQPASFGGSIYLSRSRYDSAIWRGYGGITHIVHLAPVDPGPALKLAKQNSARLLYASSGIVYHPENDTEYRQKKINWERTCLDSGVDVVIARLFTFYGERLDEHKAWTQFTKAARKHKPIRITGNGDAIRSYMHGAEMARWLWTILLHGESGEAYDVGSDKPITIYGLAESLKRDYQSPAEIIVENSTPDPIPIYLPENTRKTKDLLRKSVAMKNIFTVAALLAAFLMSCSAAVPPSTRYTTPAPVAPVVIWQAPARKLVATRNPDIVPGPAIPYDSHVHEEGMSFEYQPEWKEVCVSSLVLRGSPDKQSMILGYLEEKDRVLVSEVYGDWSRAYDRQGWVMSQYLCDTVQPGGW